ncbi:DUF6056 family protein [Streptomyces sp. NRRL F-2664]|uniref:DUF6056 family protein n=1 Tax=Streptomyces sp. NRRL F-2664 TaxID=1463842 RepID=UPI00131EA176|nr:DUF6056 family protein [Streptomyces sp. NRRL F-2664]
MADGKRRSNHDDPLPEDTAEERAVRPWINAATTVTLGLLVTLCVLSLNVRPAADDWCFIADLRKIDPVTFARHFYFKENGRFVNGLIVGIYASAGISGIVAMPIVLAISTFTAIGILVANLEQGSGVRFPTIWKALIAGVCSLALFLVQPAQYQTFFWAAGVVSHTLPPTLAAFLVVWALRCSSRASRTVCLIASFAGGAAISLTSEETAVALIAALFVLLAVRMLRQPLRRNFLTLWSGVSTIGLTVGIVILTTSPGSRSRRRMLGMETHLELNDIAGGAGDWVHVISEMITTWGYAPVLVTGLAAGSVLARNVELPISWFDKIITPALLVSAASLASMVLVRISLGRGGYLTHRVWNDFRLGFILMLAWYGFVLGAFLAKELSSRQPWLLSAWSFLLLPCAILVFLAPPVFSAGREAFTRAEAWDSQDASIRYLVSRGERSPSYTPHPIGGLVEPFSGPNKSWVRACAARYYEVPSLRPAE